MSKETLQQAMQQILQSYQRCGLKWFQSSPGLSLSPDIVRALADSDDVLGNETSSGFQHLDRQSPGQLPTATQPFKDSVQRGSVDIPRSEAAAEVSGGVAPSVSSAQQPTPPKNVGAAVGSSGNPLILSPEAGHAHHWPPMEREDDTQFRILSDLAQQVSLCNLCTEICDYRQKTVFGVGPIRPTVCFMGEAPGADEDRTGIPFVGAAGQLLTRIIEATQLKREDVYILNALKCRPPNNRTPTDSEIANCRPFLLKQLEALQPKFIVCLGAVAVRSLLNSTTSIGRLRGKIYQFRGAKVIVTYHPSYLLRQQQAKRFVWEDMQMLMRELGIQLPNKS